MRGKLFAFKHLVDTHLPASTGSTGTLSDKLSRSEGVIKPRRDVDPEIEVPAPVPNPGTTPVIPPPGTPGGDERIRPK